MKLFTVRRILKGSFLFLTLAGALALIHYSGLDQDFNTTWVDAHIAGRGAYGHMLFVGIGALLTGLAAPRQFVAFLGGYAFGALLGTLWATLAAVLSCICTFYYARLSGQRFMQRRFGRRVAKVNTFLARSPFAMSFVIRCLPVGNNLLTNLLAGVTTISGAPFFAGSALGYIPQHFIFALLGSGVHVEPLWRTIASGGLFVVSTVLGYALYRRYRIDAELEVGVEESP